MLTPEEMFDRPLDGQDKQNQIPHFWGSVFYGITHTLQKLLTRYETHGLDNIRNLQGTSGAIIAATHHSFLDPPFIWCAVHPVQWCRFMAHDRLFKKFWLMSQVIARVGAFPVTRDSADKTAVKRAVHMLKNKELVCIFPEGTRRGKTDTPPLLHGGAALIARMAKVPLIPACARNSDKIKERGKFLIHLPKVQVLFGKPVRVEWFGFLPKKDRLEGCVWYVMRESFALQEGCAPEDVDMVALFPDTKDYTAVFAEHRIGEGCDEDH